MSPGPRFEQRGSNPDVIAAIRERRSVRTGFTQDPVSEEAVEQIIQCGLAAPSSKNAQPWRLHVVTNKVDLLWIAAAVRSAGEDANYVPIDPATGRERPDWPSTVVESSEIVGNVPLGIFIENRGEFSGGRRSLARARREHLENALVGYSLEVLGLGGAIQNMLLAAHAHGLSGLFVGDVLIAEDAIRERLGMSGDLVGVIACGYVTDHPEHTTAVKEGRYIRHD